MLLAVDDCLAWKVALNHVLEATVVAQQSQFDDVVRKFFPLHGAIAIYVDLLEQFNKCKGYLHMVLLIRPVKVEVFEHHAQKLFYSEALLLLLEALLDYYHLLLVQHLHNVCLSELLMNLGRLRAVFVHATVAQRKT